ncbi:ARM repeat-containing protein [Piromyces finnis]|uniref:eIF-2-alpha kinase activator GCN1 n=1 Tax=Piromyces finnis TaxID=1754191 RepID=A0A1Y1VAV1_9FUNG|nr:ARM repeat-containing protein [Piromyces finnis]|eukprot:ORX50637.1 ARM repeat-containing protein [Piromyces finnis]
MEDEILNNSTEDYSEDIDIGYTNVPWESLINDIVPAELLSSSIKRRLYCLENLNKKFKGQDFQDNLTPTLLKILLLTVPRYMDNASRTEVINLLKNIYENNHRRKNDEPCDNVIIKTLSHLIEKENKSILNSSSAKYKYVYLTWTYNLLDIVLSETTKTIKPTVNSLLKSQSLLLEQILLDNAASPSIKKQSIKVARKVVIKKRRLGVESYLNYALNNDGKNWCLILGLAVDVAVRKNWKDIIEEKKDEVMKFYNKNIVNGKGVNEIYLDSFMTFIDNFMSYEMFKADIYPSVNRLLLRSPETILSVLNNISKYASFDMMPLLSEKSFLDNALSNAYSTNENTKKNAQSLFNTILSKTKTNDESSLSKIIKSLMKLPAGKNTPEAKQFAYSTCTFFSFLPINVVKDTVNQLITLSGRESNELTIKSIDNNIAYLLSIMPEDKANQDIINSVMQYLTNGLSKGSKSAIRLAHLSGIKNCLNEKTFKFVSENNKGLVDLVNTLLNTLKKVQTSGIGMLNTNTVKDIPSSAEGYYSIEWLQNYSKWENENQKSVVEQILEEKNFYSGLFDKASYLLNHKIYSKLQLSEDEDFSFANVIINLLKRNDIEQLISECENEFSDVVDYLSITCKHYKVRNFINDEIKTLMISSLKNENLDDIDFYVRIVSTGIVNLLKESDEILLKNQNNLNTLAWPEDASYNSSDFEVKLYNTLKSLVPNVSSIEGVDRDIVVDYLEDILLKLVIILSHPRIVKKLGIDGWLQLCYNVEIDPVNLVSVKSEDILTKWMNKEKEGAYYGTLNINDSTFLEATLNAILMFTSISEDTVLPITITNAINELNNYRNTEITQTDIDIWNTPEGELYDDPLKKNDKGSNKKDDWERKLQKEIEEKRRASGRAVQQKLTKEQKSLVEKQLAKESEIRKNVQSVYDKVKTAILIMNSVISGVTTSNKSYLDDEAPKDTTLDKWMGIIIDTLLNNVILYELNISKNGEKKEFIYRDAIDTLGKLGGCLPKRVQDVITPPLLLMTTLRSFGVGKNQENEEIPSHWSSITINTLVKNSLTKLISYAPKFITPSSFAYMYPLIDNVLNTRGIISTIPEKNRLDFIEKCIEYIGKYYDEEYASCDSIKNTSILNCLLNIVGQYPKFVSKCSENIVKLCEGVKFYQESIYEEEEEEEDSNIEKENELSSLEGEDNDSFVSALLDGLLSESKDVRSVCLKGLTIVDIPYGELETKYNIRDYISAFDEDEAVSAFSMNSFIERNGEDVHTLEEITGIADLIIHKYEVIRNNSAKALAKCVKDYPEVLDTVIDKIYETYKDLNAPPVPEYDEYGMVIKESLIKEDNWEARSGLATALKFCAPSLESCSSLEKLYKFLIYDKALGDENDNVSKIMLDAGLIALKLNGKNHIQELLNIMNGYLSKPSSGSEDQDTIRESVVISLGTLSQHLDPSDPSIPVVISKLIDTLKTPSEAVQEAVANCIPGLIKVIGKDESAELVKKLLDGILNGSNYGERRGNAYGLAGVVKGRGMVTLKECDVMQTLKEAVENKKKYEYREGSLCAFETLSMTLGRLFEPYIIQIIPYLLTCFGDPKPEVREATQDAARVIMGKISGHCVKLILPSLLVALEDKNWRTKTGSIEFLGTMAFCVPKQLSVSLPAIIPSLCEVLSDSHIKVQEAAKNALNNFGQVIKNPEIQELVPSLIDAMVNPDTKTQTALKDLLETAFVHYIDAPSLALVMPIISRGLRERNSETKKMASQIMGNMSSLTDKKDIVPYIERLMPSLKEVLIDPNPEARAFASKALGTMIEKLGEDNFPELMSELMTILKSDTSAVDRSGAAQGLSEVLRGLGINHMEKLLPEVIENTSSSKQHVREGFMTLLVYLPATFGDQFQNYLSKIIPCILHGLADDVESVREVSLRAGQMIVQNYSTTAVDLLLPALKRGLFDDNWRIRLSSIQLLGDLLYRIIGISKNNLNSDDIEQLDVYGSETARKVLIFTLGDEGYMQVLASIYIVRSDTSAVVRQCSIHIWKSIVANTPKTLKEILPILMNMLINNLASAEYEKRQAAARTLGDLVRKLGEGILDEILPTFDKGLESPNVYTRQGVCIGIGKILGSIGKTQLADFSERMIPLVQKSLVDSEATVREASAQAFDVLLQSIGNKAIDEILPKLLTELKDGDNSTYALEALKELMAVRAYVVFPVLIPTLISQPITAFNASALGSLISVAGEALTRKLNVIIPALMNGLEQEDDAQEEIREALKIAVSSVDDEDGIAALVELLLETIRDTHVTKCKSGCYCLEVFCSETHADLSMYIPDLLNVLINLLNHKDDEIVEISWKTLSAVTNEIKKDTLDNYVNCLRKSIAEACENLGPEEPLKGFCLPKGLKPVIPIYLHGLMYSSSETRECAAQGIGELIQRTSAESLKPFVTQITGPLIRIIGDRFPWQVKAAILKTLNILLAKVPIYLKPFLPQLQRIFTKSLTESQAVVRNQAAKALSVLVPLQPRLDPLIVEINTGYKNASDSGVKEAMLAALYNVLKTVKEKGKKISPATCTVVEKTILSILNDHNAEQKILLYAAQSFGSYCAITSEENASKLIKDNIDLFNDSDSVEDKASSILSLLNVTYECQELINKFGYIDDIVDILKESFESIDTVIVCDNAVKIAGQLMLSEKNETNDLLERLVPSLVVLLKERPSECKRTALIVIKKIAKKDYASINPFLNQLIPVIMTCVRDRNIPVKLSSERALIYLFDLKNGNDVLQNYLKTLEGPAVRSTGDYAKRVLTKLASQDVDSEDEDIFATI